MAKTKNRVETVGELLYWSYANLAMAHTAVDRKQETYGTFNFMIRAKLFKGLKDGTMKMRSIFDDEKIKLQTGQVCNYCGCPGKLALDHIFAKKIGGPDTGDNLIYACKSCNSSKGKKDLMEWMDFREQFLPLMIIRRYLKIVFIYCAENNLLETKLDDTFDMELPFRLDLLPTAYPNPDELSLNCMQSVSHAEPVAPVVVEPAPEEPMKPIVVKARKPKKTANTLEGQGEFDFGE